jgi:hypothetical protein
MDDIIQVNEEALKWEKLAKEAYKHIESLHDEIESLKSYVQHLQNVIDQIQERD